MIDVQVRQLLHRCTSAMYFIVGAVIITGGCRPPMLMVRDAVPLPEQETTVGAYVHRKPLFPFLHDVEGAHVDFLVNNRVIGSGVTDRSGTVEISAKLAADDHVLLAESKVDGRQLRATSRIFHWDPAKVIIVIDIDNTISFSEVRKILGMRKPTLRPIAHSKETLVELSGKFQFLYVTARPRRVLEESRTWLEDHGYPAGPVFTAPGVTEIDAKVQHKIENIMRLKRQWPGVLIGIGNKASDAEAYGRCGMLSIIVRPQREEDHKHHSIFMPSWYSIAKFFDANMETLSDLNKLKAFVEKPGSLILPVTSFEEGTRSKAEEDSEEKSEN